MASIINESKMKMACNGVASMKAGENEGENQRRKWRKVSMQWRKNVMKISAYQQPASERNSAENMKSD
jgi:uncharacterized membrane protein